MENIFKNRFDLLALEQEVLGTWLHLGPFQNSSSITHRMECVSFIGNLAAVLDRETCLYVNPAKLPVSDGQVIELEAGDSARWTPEDLYAEIGLNPVTLLEQKKFLLTREVYPKFLDAMTAIRDLLQYYATRIWVGAEGKYKFRITKIR